MSRLPIRVRVAGAFAVTLAVVLAGMGAFLYLRLGADLRSALDRELRLRADDVAALVRTPGGSLAASTGTGLVERGESFAQLFAEDGTLLDATSTVRGEALLRPAEVRDALRSSRFLDRPSAPGLDEQVRLLVVPVEHVGAPAVIVVGATAEDRAEALTDLRNALLVVGPIALLLATGAGYVLAGSGLRSVETMRRRAAEISAARPGERLPVPRTRDELERLGRTLNEMLERLELALERERGFVADAGHELRTPLTLLRAELDFALHHAVGEEELRAAVRQASDETDRLVQLAGDLLLIASTGEGALSLRIERLPAADLLESVRNRFLWRATDAGRLVDLEVEDGTTILCDRLRLEQALGNLVENALRHGDGEVVLAATRRGEWIALAVTDHGPGFPPAYLPRAFERFSRPDEGRTGSGAGLGLAIVDTIARAHGGSAQAENAPGAGARVTLLLPGG